MSRAPCRSVTREPLGRAVPGGPDQRVGIELDVDARHDGDRAPALADRLIAVAERHLAGLDHVAELRREHRIAERAPRNSSGVDSGQT